MYDSIYMKAKDFFKKEGKAELQDLKEISGYRSLEVGRG